MLVITLREAAYGPAVCRATNGAILGSPEHLTNSVRSSIWKCIDFSNPLYGWRYCVTLLPFKTEQPVLHE